MDPASLRSNGAAWRMSGGEIGMFVLETVLRIWREFASGKAFKAIREPDTVGLGLTLVGQKIARMTAPVSEKL